MKRGFTLIELLVVVAIIGMLSSVVLSSLNQARSSSRDARRASDMNQIKSALELYASANQGRYPLRVDDVAGCEGDTSYCLTNLENELVPDYIASIPLDPFYGDKQNYGYRYHSSTGGSGDTRFNLLRWSEKDRKDASGTNVGPGWCRVNVQADRGGWSTTPDCP